MELGKGIRVNNWLRDSVSKHVWKVVNSITLTASPSIVISDISSKSMLSNRLKTLDSNDNGNERNDTEIVENHKKC